MKILHFTKNSPEWLQAREGKLASTKNKELISSKGISKDMIVQELTSLNVEFKKGDTIDSLKTLLSPETLKQLEINAKRNAPKMKGFYQLVADKLKLKSTFFPEGYELKEDGRARGHRVEPIAIEAMKKVFTKSYPQFTIDDSCVICVSEENDDVQYSPDSLFYENDDAIGTLEIKALDDANHVAMFMTQDWSDYEYQILQGFIVNPKQKFALLGFYNEHIVDKPMFAIAIAREEMKEKITELQETHSLILTEVYDAVDKIKADKTIIFNLNNLI